MLLWFENVPRAHICPASAASELLTEFKKKSVAAGHVKDRTALASWFSDLEINFTGQTDRQTDRQNHHTT